MNLARKPLQSESAKTIQVGDFALMNRARSERALVRCDHARFDEFCACQGARIEFLKNGDVLVKQGARLTAVMIYEPNTGMNGYYAA